MKKKLWSFFALHLPSYIMNILSTPSITISSTAELIITSHAAVQSRLLPRRCTTFILVYWIRVKTNLMSTCLKLNRKLSWQLSLKCRFASELFYYSTLERSTWAPDCRARIRLELVFTIFLLYRMLLASFRLDFRTGLYCCHSSSFSSTIMWMAALIDEVIYFTHRWVSRPMLVLVRKTKYTKDSGHRQLATVHNHHTFMFWFPILFVHLSVSQQHPSSDVIIATSSFQMLRILSKGRWSTWTEWISARQQAILL